MQRRGQLPTPTNSSRRGGKAGQEGEEGQRKRLAGKRKLERTWPREGYAEKRGSRWIEGGKEEKERVRKRTATGAVAPKTALARGTGLAERGWSQILLRSQ